MRAWERSPNSSCHGFETQVGRGTLGLSLYSGMQGRWSTASEGLLVHRQMATCALHLQENLLPNMLAQPFPKLFSQA